MAVETDRAHLFATTQRSIALYLDVVNAPPTVDPLPDVTIAEGQVLDVAATFSDPGIDEPYTATVDFGTGDGPEPATVVLSSTTPPQTGTASASRSTVATARSPSAMRNSSATSPSRRP